MTKNEKILNRAEIAFWCAVDMVEDAMSCVLALLITIVIFPIVLFIEAVRKAKEAICKGN